jgi:LacI family transcriptional regulator
MKTDRRKLVVAVIPTDTAAGRAELRGVSDAARRLGWDFETIDSAIVGANLAPFRSLLARADGVILRLYDSLRDGTLASLGVPLVGLDTGVAGNTDASRKCAEVLWASVLNDHRKVAEAAADELLATGRRCFAFVPMLLRYPWTGTRGRAFLSRIRAAGADARLYEPRTKWGWVEERNLLSRWLAELPRPFGVFAGNDSLAKFTLDACRSAGLHVPGDAAILGADDDEALCLTATPPLSSIRIDFEGAGRRAAEALDALIGKPRPARTKVIRFGILGVARRGSTRHDTSGADPRVMAGLDFIALHYADPFIGVRDVAVAMGTGRRQAERLFAALGKSIHTHLEEARIACEKKLLLSGETPVGEVARLSGFTSETYFSRLFHSRTGLAPLAFRRSN